MGTSASSVVSCPACGRRNRVPASATGSPRCASCHRALAWSVESGDDDFDAVAERSPLPVLVDLWAPWCGPCRMVSPAVEQIGRDLAGSVKVVKVNVDDAPRVASRFAAQSIPTLLVLDHGRVVDRQVGAAPLAVLRGWVDRALATTGRSTSGG
ncbi:MAG: thioredoxin [Actinomycetota bacterium]|nr:thioredoxin [Actinomycetota bacterium]